MPHLSYYSFFITLLVGQLPANTIDELGGDASIELVQDKVPCIREGERVATRKDFYHKFLLVIFLAICGKMPRIKPSLIDLLLKKQIGGYFILEEYPYVSVYGSKLPLKALSKYTPFSLICLDIVSKW